MSQLALESRDYNYCTVKKNPGLSMRENSNSMQKLSKELMFSMYKVYTYMYPCIPFEYSIILF